MATFYPQLTSNESLTEQWNRYLKQRPLVLNIEDIIHEQTSEYKQMLNETSSSIRNDINNSTAAVCGTIESGFDLVSEHLRELSYGLDDIRYEINAMSSILHWGFTQTLEQLRITNLLLGNISLLLKIPDYQKERQDYIEKGLKFLKNAYFDSEMYDDALKYLLKAEELEPGDFFTLYRIGLIYLNSPKGNINLAEQYFKKSAKYAIVETNEGATISNNLLSLDVNYKFDEQLKLTEKIKLEASEAFLLAARSCFLQNKFSEAAILANRAYQLIPNFVEAGFLEAQSLSANNEISKTVEVLRTVIQTDRFYSFKTSRNVDLGSQKEIIDLLEEFKREASNRASNLLNSCKINMIPGSVVENEIRKIENLINKGTFLHSMKALDLLKMERNIKYSSISKELEEQYHNPKINFNEIHDYFTKLIKRQDIYDWNRFFEYSLNSIVENFDNKLNLIFLYLNENTQWEFKPLAEKINPYNRNDYIFSKLLKIEISSKLESIDLHNFIIKEKFYSDKLYDVKKEIEVKFDILEKGYFKVQKEKIDLEKEYHDKWQTERLKGKIKAGLTLGFFGALFFGILFLSLGFVDSFKMGFLLGYILSFIIIYIYSWN